MSCLVPTIQILQPSVTNPILRPRLTRGKNQHSTTSPSQQRRKKSYPTGSTSRLSLQRLPKMRLTALRNSALFSLLGLTSAQSSPSTWAQTQPFNVDASTESLLSSAQQGLTNIVGTNTPSTTAAAPTTTGLAPAVSITDEFSTTMPTELSSGSSVGEGGSGMVTVTSSRASAESSRSASVGSLSSSESVRANSSATIPSEGAAAPTGVGARKKVMGVAGVLAGAAGVMFV
ncbi:hypothetical protein B5807_04138 [Epicoccum nigrum]|uniref:Uncharacterized protein n=1 Tax=Epicoccum nigrum TaxID=105696 RepID=A0A1Y2M3C2_EPING|nr:hypothetical protein B5807_04138 [Epicoccum nigrum]